MKWGEMTEFISRCWNSGQTERVYTGEDIFNYSPTGELFMIPQWALRAVAYFDEHPPTDEETKRLYDMAKQWETEFIQANPNIFKKEGNNRG